MADKISIIVPIYNVEQYLDRCVKSIINQTYRKLEILLVDDGSPDMCRSICDQYAKEDSRIKVLHKENGGLSDARNAGLDIATGDFIIFIDSDDYVELEMCQKLIDNVSDEIDIVSYGFRRFYDEDIEPCKCSGKVLKFAGKELFEKYIKRQHFTHMVCDKMFRRYLFNDVRFIKGRLAEDMAICYQLMGKAKGAISIDETFYNYYTRSDSIMGTGSLKLCIDAYKGECEAYNYGNQYFPEYKKVNDIRLLNQSMKVYLKLTKFHKLHWTDEVVQFVFTNVQQIEKQGLPIKSLVFYYIFITNKSLAWYFYKVFKLT